MDNERSIRIDEIAAWLPDEPKADGARIGDRVAWGRLAALPEATDAVAAAEDLSGRPMPELTDERYLDFTRNGNRIDYEIPYFERAYRLDAFLLAECLENRGRFLPKIVEYAEAICSERTWTAPAHDDRLTAFHGTPHVELFSAERCLKLARTRDWLLGILPEGLSARIASECDRRVFQPYLLTARNLDDKEIRDRYPWHGWFEAGLNWSSVCHSCVVRAALAVVHDRRIRAEIVAAAEGSLPVRMKYGFLPDGYCTEGIGYWNYGYGHHVMMGLSVRAATGGKVDFFRNPKNRLAIRYAYEFQLEKGKSPPFADGVGGPDIGVLALARQVCPDISSHDAANLGLLGYSGQSRVKCPLSIISLRSFGQDPGLAAGGEYDTLPVRSWFPEAMVLVSRAPSGTGGLSLAVKGGNNDELHNHNDLGSYTVMLDSVEMCGDPGKVVYRRDTFSERRYDNPFMGSFGHPVPVAGGGVQRTGRDYAARVLDTEFSDGRDLVRYDLAKAYVVPQLKSLVRTVVFERDAMRVTVEDRVVFDRPSAFEVPVVTYRGLKGDPASGRFTLRHPGGGRSLSVSVTGSSPLAFHLERIDNPGMEPVSRLGFSLAKPQMRAVVKTVFEAY